MMLTQVFVTSDIWFTVIGSIVAAVPPLTLYALWKYWRQTRQRQSFEKGSWWS